MADQDPSKPLFYDKLIAPPNLEQRVWAAAIDMTLAILCGTALFHSFGPLSTKPQPLLWWPAAALLVGVALLEAFTGGTVGKLLMKLEVRRRDGGRAPMKAHFIRAIVKYTPVAIFVASLSVGSLGFLLIAITGFTLAIAEVQACYLAIMRSGLTIYDHLAGTKVVKRTADRQ